MRTVGPTGGLAPIVGDGSAPALVTHDQARRAIQALHADTDADVGAAEHARLLMRYVAEREQTSADMRNVVRAVMEVFGAPGLAEIQGRVEAMRKIVGRKQ